MTRARDGEILREIERAYEAEFGHMGRLDSKLNNFCLMAATVATLFVGIGFFSLERISRQNPYYLVTVGVFLVGLSSFVLAIMVSLIGYKPAYYYITPKDPAQLIEDYSKLSLVETIHVLAATKAAIIPLNRNVNVVKTVLLRVVFWILSFGMLMVLVFAILIILALGAA